MSNSKTDILSEAYQRLPTLRNYVALRRTHPDTQIHCPERDIFEVMGDFDEPIDFDIPSELILFAVTGECAAISELSLRLMELLIEREAIQSTGESAAIRRGIAVSDVFINRLIELMLDGLDRRMTSMSIVTSWP
jgi:hypothetical protein